MLESVAACQQWAQAQGLARGDVMSILQNVLGVSSSWLRAHDTDILTPEHAQTLVSRLTRRLQGEPVAYINGEKEFYGLRLLVDNRVLIPRPETEMLVDFARKNVPQGSVIADIGTGSGAIALAVASVRPDLTVLASDISAAALQIAKNNALALQVQDRVHFFQGHLLAALAPTLEQCGPLQCIVSNPPYIDAADAHLMQGDLRFEPAHALTDGADGLSLIRELVAQAPAMLDAAGWLVVEHGYAQGEAIRDLFHQQSQYTEIETHKDLAGLERMTLAKKISSV
jgi:release factor glutamine methyltransferase